MNEGSPADRPGIPTLANMLNKSIFLTSNTNIGQDGKVHSYCGLRLADIPAAGAGTSSASKYAHTRVSRRPKGVPVVYHNLGPPSHQCSMCNATMWYNERSKKSRKAVTPTFSLCCQEGKVLLPKFNDTPQPLKKLLDYNDPTTSRFKDQIRVYNSMFCFTSFGARIDHSVNSGRGPYTFRINGQNYHRMGSLLPAEGVPPRYAQLYFFNTQNEIRNRMSAFMSKETPETVDKNIVANLTQMLDQTSVMAKLFRMAKEWCRSHGDANFGLRLLSERTVTRQYNTHTIYEVSTLIINNFGDGLPTRDIVVNKNNTGHPSYMALQYPLLFLFGEDGYHENIPYHINKGIRKTKRGYVTMKEYYAYIIQQQQNQGTTLLRGGRLFQQYLVDAFTAIKEQRLNWTRNNQDTLRVDLYHNLCDVVTRGDTSAAELGKRIVLPRTYIGSPRYMMHNYQDAMDLCRTYGNPDMFITFTSNLKWPEIVEMLGYILGQKSHDRPEVGTRFFKMKLTELLEDLTKHHIFGKSYAVVYVIENSTCGIKQNTHLAELMQHVWLIIWDEAPMTQRYAFEALDKTLRDILGYKNPAKRNRIFGGTTVLLGGDFRQILPVIPNAKRPEDEPTWIEIPEEFLIKSWTSPIEQIVAETYPDFTSRQTDDDYLKERAIITPRNDDADAINENMFKKLGGAPVTYNSADKICKASTDTSDQHNLYPVEFLNSLNFQGIPSMSSA
ncbi:ATP-dependent DNA helicase PIF1 [Tanacetum coccineum]|uniref:ATP-dependent DNA helicase PIF1 n=1 Tax=Tanacetum coccineum TaxID=301880 RepID=A0ABQ5GW07_9ASTR